MQLNLQALRVRAQTAVFAGADGDIAIRERIVTAAATTLGVMVVALIAVLMGLVN